MLEDLKEDETVSSKNLKKIPKGSINVVTTEYKFRQVSIQEEIYEQEEDTKSQSSFQQYQTQQKKKNTKKFCLGACFIISVFILGWIGLFFYLYSDNNDFVLNEDSLDRSNAQLIAATIDADNQVYAISSFTQDYLLYILKSKDSPCQLVVYDPISNKTV